MTCEDVSGNEIVEKYLLGQLGDDVRESFEEHYFECARCFGLVQTYRDVQAELARTRKDLLSVTPARRWVWQWAWVPAAAVVVIAASVALWQPPLPGNLSPAPEVARPAPDLAPAAPESPAPSPAPPPKPSLDQLARFEPPRYVPGSLRGVADAATMRFKEGMEHYQQGRYAAAAGVLLEASSLDPEAPHILFFLGISQLLAGQTDPAIDALGKAITLGDSPYLEEAHFYRAKAFVRRGNLDGASAELEGAIRLRGEREADARDFLRQLRAQE
jgi:tetratricopeptide (TPR) repeat protein